MCSNLHKYLSIHLHRYLNTHLHSNLFRRRSCDSLPLRWFVILNTNINLIGLLNVIHFWFIIDVIWLSFIEININTLVCFIPHKVILQLWTSERKCSQSLSYTPPSSTSDCNEPVKILLPSENVGRTFSRTNLEKLHDVCDIKYLLQLSSFYWSTVIWGHSHWLF